MSEHIGLRGQTWFAALTGRREADLIQNPGDPESVLSAEARIGQDTGLFLCVTPNPESRFPCVRDGQVGLEEAYALAAHVRRAMKEDRQKSISQKRPIIAIVDVKSQAYGRREETAGIFLAAATAADAYAQTEQTDKANAMFRETMKISTISETYYHYALFLQSQGRMAEAREWAQKILDKKPTMPGYLRRRERPWFRKASGLLAHVKTQRA